MHRKMLCIQSLSSTSVEIPTQVQNPTQVEIVPQVECLSQEPEDVAPSRAALIQDSSVELESRALEGLERGYTRLPNQILMQLASGDVTRNEMRIVLLIARFTISFRREMAPLSKKVLERQSGLRGAAVLEAVSGLVAKGIVRKTQGDQHRPNLLGLVLPENWDAPGTKGSVQPDKIGPQILPFPKSMEDRKPDHAQVEETTTGPVQNPTPFKDIKKYKTKNSPEDIPQNLRPYFESLKPDRKRESELRAFEKLSHEYEPDDISECMTLLLKRGVRAGKAGYQPCHSPMAYLSKAIEEVLGDVRRTRHTLVSQEKLQSDKKNRDVEDGLQREACARELAAIEAAFQIEFPTAEAQSRIVDEICRNMPFRPAPRIQRLYAIQKWFEGKCSVNPTTSTQQN